MIKLREVGFFRELNLTKHEGLSLKEVVNKSNLANKEKVINYLKNAPWLFGSYGVTSDVLDPSSQYVGNKSIFTDGVWVWPKDLAYYLERYNVELPTDFVEHIKEREYQPPDESEIHFEEIYADS